jgi:hypothetical protein
MLLLSVLAVGRIVINGFFQRDEANEVIVILVPGETCVSDTIAPGLVVEH